MIHSLKCTYNCLEREVAVVFYKDLFNITYSILCISQDQVIETISVRRV